MARRAQAPSRSTREALLAAAAEVFAERGYELARVRDIAARAGANLAAINYHFRGKRALYLAVLEAQAEATVRRFPIAGATPGGSFEQRLRGTVRSLLGRFVANDVSAQLPKLLVRELAQPTPALDTIVDHVARPQLQQLSALVEERLGPRAPRDRVLMSAFSIVSQCLFYLFARPLVARLSPQLYKPAQLDALADHIGSFAMAGLDAVRRTLESPA